MSARSPPDRQMLKPKCVDALRRIFKLCDVNKDGVLDPAELNDFQVRSPALHGTSVLPCQSSGR